MIESTFEAKVKFTFRADPGGKNVKHVSTVLKLVPIKGLDPRIYLNKGERTKDGVDVLSHVLIQGLVANIYEAHHAGHIDGDQHLKEIVETLQIMAERVMKGVTANKLAELNKAIENKNSGE